jgi:PAS domain-containing protein
MIGVPREDHLGTPAWSRVQPASAAKELQDTILSVIATGEFKRLELLGIIPSRGAEPVVMDFTFKPIHDAQGDVIFVVLEARDITQRRQAEAHCLTKNRFILVFGESDFKNEIVSRH